MIAAILGADEFGFGTASLLAIGCVMARQCHLNTCPVGIATQDEKLRTRFAGKPEMVVAYFRYLAEEVRKRMAELGRALAQRTVADGTTCWARAPGWMRCWWCPFPNLAAWRRSRSRRCTPPRAKTSLHFAEDLSAQKRSRSAIHNSDRSVGAGMSGELMRRAAERGRALTGEIEHEYSRFARARVLAHFWPRASRCSLRGEANDYVGKGLSGGTIAISAGRAASRRGDVLVGNTVLYGATSGQLYVAGRAGERFGVRNSGALAVVEGVGQHGCEYMTGGVALILGPLGLNFGSGMTGGLAYVLRAEAEDVLHREFRRAGGNR